MKNKSNNAEAIANNALTTVESVISSMFRANVRFFRNLPMRCVNYFKRVINDYKRRPPRTDINKVYVLVGYTTKGSVDAKYNRERRFIILRKGLLVLIFFLILFISINRLIPFIDVDAYKTMFGIGSVEEMTENDPFSSNSNNYIVEYDYGETQSSFEYSGS